MLNEMGNEDLVGELMRSVLSFVAARFQSSDDETRFPNTVSRG